MPRWEPKSEAAIQQALDEGALAESHVLDVKKETGSTDGERKETARDLASFAIDGGALLIGVAEDKAERRFSLAPQALTGLVERVELIARQRIDPPLYIQPREIPSTTDPARGYLWVDVPTSSEAPHMVDGVYYGRGERTRQRLSDAEVVRLHERRHGAASRVSASLDDEVARDHVRPEDRQNGHLWIAALPLSAPDELAVPLLASEDLRFFEAAVGADRHVPLTLRSQAPAAVHLSTNRRVAGGRAVSSYAATGAGRTLQTDAGGLSAEHNLIDLTLRDDGQVRLTLGRATTVRGDQLVVLDGLIYAWLIRVAAIVSFVGAETAYGGSWGLATRVDRLRGAVSSTLTAGDVWGTRTPIYDRDIWTASTTTTTAEVGEAPRKLADRLLGSLLRSLGSQPALAAAQE